TIWIALPLRSTLFPYTTLFRSAALAAGAAAACYALALLLWFALVSPANHVLATWTPGPIPADFEAIRWRWEIGHMAVASAQVVRSEEHTSELQSLTNLVCRLLP